MRGSEECKGTLRNILWILECLSGKRFSCHYTNVASLQLCACLIITCSYSAPFGNLRNTNISTHSSNPTSSLHRVMHHPARLAKPTPSSLSSSLRGSRGECPPLAKRTSVHSFSHEERRRSRMVASACHRSPGHEVSSLVSSTDAQAP